MRQIPDSLLGEEDALLELAGVAAWKYFSDGTFDWSPAMYDMFQLDPDSTPQDIVARYHPDDRNLVTRGLTKSLRTREPVPSYYRIVLPSGEVRQILSKIVARDGEKGVEIVGVNIDVTSMLKEMELSFEEVRRFKFISENARDLIVRYSADFIIQFVSPSAKVVLGYDPEELIGKSIFSVIDPEAHPKTVTALNNILAAERAVGPSEVLVVRKDGSRVWLEGNARPAYNVFGELIEWVDVLRDISERKDAEKALIKALADADAAAEAKSQFLANMSHELRTPLTSIIGFSDLLSKDENISAKSAGFIDRISRASRTLLNVVNDVLDLSKLENGALDLDPTPFCPVRLVEEAIELVSPQATNKQIRIECHFEPPFRNDPPLWLHGDDMRINQVLLNLLSNAIKFTDKGAIVVRVAAQPSDTGRMLLTIRVKDSGIGMSADQISRLFDRFSQADGSISRRYGGTGLGLAISRRLMELMGGSITVESEVGQGSCFTVEVELDTAEPDAESAGEAPVDLAPSINVLLAEDNPANRELVGALLEDTGVKLSFATNGAEALEMVTKGEYDLVLMDIQMPVMDGVTATKAIRRLGGRAASLPIIALSANVLPGQIRQYEEDGFSGHVGKPINVGALFSAISSALSETT